MLKILKVLNRKKKLTTNAVATMRTQPNKKSEKEETRIFKKKNRE